jgi:undecaprenyl-diphosphatase
MLPLIVGVAAAAVSGWLAIAVLLRFVARRSYGIFAVYRLVLGLVIFAMMYFRG